MRLPHELLARQTDQSRPIQAMRTLVEAGGLETAVDARDGSPLAQTPRSPAHSRFDERPPRQNLDLARDTTRLALEAHDDRATHAGLLVQDPHTAQIALVHTSRPLHLDGQPHVADPTADFLAPAGS